MDPIKPQRILFIRLSAVGDVINTLPALSALRKGFPGARIGFLVEDRTKDIVTAHPLIDTLHVFPRKRFVRMARRPWKWPSLLIESYRFIRELRRERYDVALDFQGNLKGGVLSLLSGSALRVGYGRGHSNEMNHLFSHVRVVPPTKIINRVDKFLALVASIGAPVDDAAYKLPDSAESRARVEGFLAGSGLAPRQYVTMHPGTSDFGREKRWMPERFAEVARRLGSENGLRTLVTWGPGERSLAEQVVAGAAGHAVLAMETRTILDLAEILRQARLFVGCDSGPLHLASAVGVPSVALFGPKDPRVYGPHNPHSRVVYKPDDNGSPMSAITVDEVCLSVQDLLHSAA